VEGHHTKIFFRRFAPDVCPPTFKSVPVPLPAQLSNCLLTHLLTYSNNLCLSTFYVGIPRPLGNIDPRLYKLATDNDDDVEPTEDPSSWRASDRGHLRKQEQRWVTGVAVGNEAVRGPAN